MTATVPIAINGLGRVGRALVRIARQRPGLEVVAVNDQAEPAVLARLLAHDSIHGRFPGEVAAEADALILDGRRVPVFSEREPGRIPWDGTGARAVVEATGQFRSRELAAPHLSEEPYAGGGCVRHVVISATAEGADATFCFGMNHRRFDPERHRVVSNASCTTNCVAPLARVLVDAFGLEHAQMQTVHCYTNSQRLVDMAHPDARRARAAATNVIPTTSDAVEALPLVVPELAGGRFGGVAYRVPVPDGSLVDLSARVGRDVAAEEVRDAFRQAAAGPLAPILAVTEEELVSSDFIGSPYSATVDLPLVQVTAGRLVRVVAWYDNEWGYANRLADLLLHMDAMTTSAGGGR
jgi:glyceraldehyde 3-phosphate dehydrogenase